MPFRIEISPLAGHSDARGHATEHKIRRYLGLPVDRVSTRDVYTICADITREEAETIASEFNHPVIQQYRIDQSEATCTWMIVTGFLPGVTDNVARSASDAIGNIIGRPLRRDEAVYSHTEYLLDAPLLKHEDVRNIATSLLANPLINSIRIYDGATSAAGAIPPNMPRIEAQDEPKVATIPLDVTDEKLIRISNEGILALTLEEMRAIQTYFHAAGDDTARTALGLGGAPTDVELEALAQTWSEHCSHKIFAAHIDYVDEETETTEHISSLFRSYIKKSTEMVRENVDWLRSVFKDNAGVIAFNDEVDLVYKVETHNSPSALDPYGGAMTGIVGVNRDPMGTGKGANLLSNVWGYCMASPYTDQQEVPEGLLHPRIIRDGVHLGVIEGGNQSGIPYSFGWEYFEERYLGKPLVFCGTIGTLPAEVQGEAGYKKTIQPGDLVVMAGGRIGKDGIHGATFSSEELHTDSPVQAVQIGDPITQKKLYDFTVAARDLGLYRFITDNGAGGLSSSVGEMAEECNGVYMDLSKAPLKYTGLQPWEILVSEAQERMSYAVPPDKIDQFKTLAEKYEVLFSVIGEFRDSGKFHVAYGEQTVAYIDLDFLHNGCPRLHLNAHWKPPDLEEPRIKTESIERDILSLLHRLNVCSGEEKARQYDHEVKGLSVIKPYVGVHRDVQSDATVFMIKPLSQDGVIVSAGILPRYSDIDTYHMTASVIDLAVRRIIAVGGKPGHIAGLDNFCWPDPVESEKTPDGPYKLAQLVRSNKAILDYCTAYQVPLISGKDSMKNDSTRGGRKISIPPTLLFSTIARMEDISKAVTLDPKQAGDLVYVLGVTKNELGGSEYYYMNGFLGANVPTVDAGNAMALYQAVSETTDKGLCHSLHTPAIGGLAVALARMCLGARLGLHIDLNKIPASGNLSMQQLLFSESNSRFVATVPSDRKLEFEALLADFPFALVGEVQTDTILHLYSTGKSIVIGIDDMLEAFRSGLY